MRWPDPIRRGLLPGALAGLIGGLLSGATLSQVGALPATASLVHSDSAAVDFVLYISIAAVLGGIFGVLVWYQRSGAGDVLFWGLTYGALWWFLGPLTLQPLLQGGFLAWDVHSAQEAFASLLAHLIYGASTGLALAAIRHWLRISPGTDTTSVASQGTGVRGAVLRGALAGLISAWLLGRMLNSQNQLLAISVMVTGVPSGRLAWLITFGIGLVTGTTFALLYQRPREGTGPGLIRGTVYGFFVWVVGPLTVLPLAGRGGLTWSLEAARAAFTTLPGYLLFGAAVAVIYQWLDGLVRLLFSDLRRSHDEEGAGTEGLLAVGRGALAGLVGGLLFTVVMVRIGQLPVIAGLIGSTSLLSGLIVQFLVAEFVGISYGLLFRRQSFDIGSGLGWGISYGFFWWILGPLTLSPLLVGASPQWKVEVAGGLFPTLIGHLAYGAGLGTVFHLLEARQNPWWIPRTRAEAARVSRRREQLLTSAPAVWTLVVVIALTLPVILGL